MTTIFWVSNLHDPSLRSSYLSQQILPELSKLCKLIIFHPEREETTFLGGIPSFNIHQLPEYVRKESDFVIIYNFEDSYSINLIEHFSKHYPGLVILHDQSIFNLKIGQLAHGSASHEFDRLFEKYYPLAGLRIGKEIVLKKSISIYRYLYTFLNSFNPQFISFITFTPSNKEIEKSSLHQIKLSFCDSTETKIIRSKNEFKILCVIKSTLSRVGLDLKRNFDCLDDNVSLNCRRVGSSWELEYDEVFSVLELHKKIEEGYFSGVLEVGNFPFQGISAFSLSAMANGVPALLEESMEAQVLGLSTSHTYCKADGLCELLDRFALIESCKVHELDYEVLSQSLLDIVDTECLHFQKIVKHFEIEKYDAVKGILDRNLEVIGQSCQNIAQIEENQKSKLKNTFNELFGIS